MQGNVKQAFVVDEVRDKYVPRTVRRYNPKTKKFVDEKTTEPVGYLVYSARGDVTRIRDEDTLRRMNLHRDPALVDMDTGDVVGRLQRKAHMRSGHNFFNEVEAE